MTEPKIHPMRSWDDLVADFQAHVRDRTLTLEGAAQQLYKAAQARGVAVTLAGCLVLLDPTRV